MYYEKNMQILQEYREQLYQLIKQQTIENTDASDAFVHSVSTRTGELALVVEKDNHQFRLNSRYNPQEEASKWAEQYHIKNLNTVVVMFGLGNGIFAREMMNKLNDDNLMIVYEPSLKIFLHVLEKYDVEDILKNKRVGIVIKGINEFEFPYLLSITLTWMNLFSKVECVHPGYEKLFETSFLDFKNTIKDNTFNNFLTKNTYGFKGKSTAENAFHNLLYLADSVSIWDLDKDLPKDIPAIVVAAGPSLNKNVEILKQAKGKSIIFAVDRSYETLLEHDIEPDFIVTLDADKKLKYCGNRRGFKDTLLCKLESSPDILDNHGGKKIIYYCNDFIVSIYKKLGKKFFNISPGASVATAAFSICVNLGFGRIVFVGQDLAYLGNVSHADLQTSGNVINDEKKAIDLYVEDIHGNTVRTRHDWYAFLRSFENAIQQLSNVDIIDATEGGARIKGTRILPLQDVVDQYCTRKFDCKSIIDNQTPTFHKKELSGIYDYLVKSRGNLDEIIELSQQAIKELSLYETNRKNNGQMLIKSIAEINGKIEKMPIFSLIDEYVMGKGANEIAGLYFVTNDKKTDEEITLSNAKAIFHNMIEASEWVIPLLENSIHKYETLL
ncbi:MAG: motility associated factor glycosyltransferase family protein [Lachnospiraceae bacterium]|jgi:hypothetical protein|nr:motility associated factor glycosyltransferase family protein [Lachnospiraceae bacterium]